MHHVSLIIQKIKEKEKKENKREIKSKKIKIK